MDYETPDMLVRVQDHVTIVRLRSANLTSMSDNTRLSAALHHLLDEGCRRLVVDFKLVEHIGSSTLGTLIALQKRLKDLGGRMAISHAETIQELLHVSQTARFFQLVPDSKAALNLLKPRDP